MKGPGGGYPHTKQQLTTSRIRKRSCEDHISGMALRVMAARQGKHDAAGRLNSFSSICIQLLYMGTFYSGGRQLGNDENGADRPETLKLQ